MNSLEDLEAISKNPHAVKTLGLTALLSFLQEACIGLEQEVKDGGPNNNTFNNNALRWIKVIQELAGYLDQTPIHFFKISVVAGGRDADN